MMSIHLQCVFLITPLTTKPVGTPWVLHEPLNSSTPQIGPTQHFENQHFLSIKRNQMFIVILIGRTVLRSARQTLTILNPLKGYKNIMI